MTQESIGIIGILFEPMNDDCAIQPLGEGRR